VLSAALAAELFLAALSSSKPIRIPVSQSFPMAINWREYPSSARTQDSQYLFEKFKPFMPSDGVMNRLRIWDKLRYAG
jgi:hypothetical protein